MMDAALKQKWIDALESGDFSKGKWFLKSKKGCYCCLGVLAELVEGPEVWVDRYNSEDRFYKMLTFEENFSRGENTKSSSLCSALPMGYAGLDTEPTDQHRLALSSLNDGTDDFKAVIEYIKKNL